MMLQEEMFTELGRQHYLARLEADNRFQTEEAHIPEWFCER
jgi:hypothetical protein